MDNRDAMIWLIVLLGVALALAVPICAFWLAGGLPSAYRIRIGTSACAIVGAAVGGYAGFCVYWSPADGKKFLGFPFPFVIFVWEDGRWVDYIGPPIGPAIDILLFIAAFTFPMLIWVLICRFRSMRRHIARDRP